MQTGIQRGIVLGADVIGEGQEKVGTVAYVVVRSPGPYMTDIVVNTGMLLGRDIVVPADAITDVADGKVYLAVDADELKQYPDYVNTSSLREPAGRLPPLEAREAAKRICTPSGTVAFKKGMEVVSSDGVRVGSVEAVDIACETGQTTALLVAHGLLGHDKSWIPLRDVALLDDTTVTLTLTKDQEQSLPREDSTS